MCISTAYPSSAAEAGKSGLFQFLWPWESSRSGYRDVFGVAEGCKEDKESLGNSLSYLKTRGLSGVKLFITDKCIWLIESLAEYYPDVPWQRCVIHFYRNILCKVPSDRMKKAAPMLKGIHAQEDRA